MCGSKIRTFKPSFEEIRQPFDKLQCSGWTTNNKTSISFHSAWVAGANPGSFRVRAGLLQRVAGQEINGD